MNTHSEYIIVYYQNMCGKRILVIMEIIRLFLEVLGTCWKIDLDYRKKVNIMTRDKDNLNGFVNRTWIKICVKKDYIIG